MLVNRQSFYLLTPEIIDEYYTMMKANVGDEFTLIYDDNSKSTSIRKGYFVEDKTC